MRNLLVRLPEAYVDGKIELCGNLLDLIQVCYRSDETFVRLGNLQLHAARIGLWLGGIHGWGTPNISHHYDLGNGFFGLWLDRQMVYWAPILKIPKTISMRRRSRNCAISARSCGSRQA